MQKVRRMEAEEKQNSAAKRSAMNSSSIAPKTGKKGKGKKRSASEANEDTDYSGRPRKRAQIQANSEESEDEHVIPKPKRGPGRPKGSKSKKRKGHGAATAPRSMPQQTASFNAAPVHDAPGYRNSQPSLENLPGYIMAQSVRYSPGYMIAQPGPGNPLRNEDPFLGNSGLDEDIVEPGMGHEELEARGNRAYGMFAQEMVDNEQDYNEEFVSYSHLGYLPIILTSHDRKLNPKNTTSVHFVKMIRHPSRTTITERTDSTFLKICSDRASEKR